MADSRAFTPGAIGNASVRFRATAGKDLRLALKINCYYLSRETSLVNTIKNGYNTTMFNKILKQIHKKLLKKEKTVAVAESCTGGLLSNLLTSLPGSSDYFILGVVTYSNKSKEMILNIPAKIIANCGAVSRQVAILMAEKIRKKTHADLGLSITGIAGPTGATSGKSIGTVYICLSRKNKNSCRKFHFTGNRKNIRKKSTQSALRLLCAHLSP